MAILKLTMHGRHRLTDVPILVEVIDVELTRVFQEPISIGQFKNTQDLPSGHYAVQAYLPSGQTLTQKAKISQSDAEIEVDFYPVQDSPSEDLEWTFITKRAPLAQPRLRPYQLRSIWLRLWGRQSGESEWSVLPWPKQYVIRHNRLVQYQFHFSLHNEYRQHYLQIGGPKMPWRLIALPAEFIHVLIKPVDQPLAYEEPIQVTVTSFESKVETLMGYINRGALDHANLVSQAIMAEGLLYAKVENPSAAAVGAYYLLRIGDLERLHTWTENLANWMEWLPDGPVIRTWHLLKQGNPPVERIRALLLEAIRRGLPVYTEGLRLLQDALVMFDEWAKGGDDEIRRALEQIRQYTAATDWRAATTSFRGRNPDNPTLMPIIGRPDNPSEVVFLEDIQLQDLIWKRLLKPESSLFPRYRYEFLSIILSESVLKALLPLLPEPMLTQIMTVAPKIPDEIKRAAGLTALALAMPEPVKYESLRQALEATLQIQALYHRVKALATLAPHLPPLLLQQALDGALAIGAKPSQVEAVVSLIPYLSEPLKGATVQRALETAQSIDSRQHQILGLAQLAPYLPETQQREIHQQCLEAVTARTRSFDKKDALIALASSLPEPLLSQALEIGLAIDDNYRTEVLTALIPHLSEPLRTNASQPAVKAASAIYYVPKVEKLAALVPYLSDPLRSQALAQAWEETRKLRSEQDQVTALEGLAPHLPDSLIELALALVSSFKAERNIAQALATLAPHMPKKLLPLVLEMATKLDNEYYRTGALTTLVPYLDEPAQSQLLAEVSETISSFIFNNSQVQVTDSGGLAFQRTGDIEEDLIDTELKPATFRSPDKAAQAIVGAGKIDGWALWIDAETGKSLDELRRIACGEYV